MRRRLRSFISLLLIAIVTISFNNEICIACSVQKTFKSEISEVTKEEKEALNNFIVKKFGTIENYDKTLAFKQKYEEKVNDENGPSDRDIKPEDEVRIIVELSQKSTIDMAKQSHISLKRATLFTNEVAAKQKNVIKTVKAMGKIRHTYQNLFNGFSAVVKFKDINFVRNLPEVKNVTIAKQYYPDMKTAVDFTQTKTVWEKAGLKGEGTVVAIVDTGIDYTHKDMKLTDKSKARLMKENVTALATEKGAKGKYFSDKVPYGYNFADLDQEIIDKSGSMHGMHVGGIVAANGDIQGVAPEAQLLAMKVFSNNPKQKSAFNDDIAAGVEESWKLGADVINMSLESPAGFVSERDPEQLAIKHATEAGTVVVISAGNYAYSTNGFDFPYEKDCDTSMLGSPGLCTDSLQVASSENTNQILPSLEYKAGEITGNMAYSVSTQDITPTSRLKEEYNIVECGLGRKEDFVSKDITGKIALIKRGECTFIDKKLNAQDAGAIGVIVYNKDNDDSYITMVPDDKVTIPSVFISNTDGKKLRELIDKGVKIFFRDKIKELDNPKASQMSTFTAWGTTPDLRFKPEVTAPGGQIYSTVNDNRYKSMSGTSMAAPHTAGAVALVVQHLKNKMPELSGRKFVEMAKTLLINTSKPLIEEGTELPYLTRRQGAGLIQIHDAVTTNVYAVDKNGSGAIALGEVKDGTNFAINLTNFGKEDITFNVIDKYGILTNAVSKDEIPKLLQKTDKMEGAKTIFDKNQITVPAGKSASVNVTLKFGKKPMNQFAEGFITFQSSDKKNCDIGVAYMGFFGKWDEPRIFDSPKWEKDSFYKAATLSDGKSFLDERTYGKIEDIAFSPNGDGIQDKIYPIVSFLRNAKEFKITVLDKDKNQLRTITKEEDIKRNSGIQQYPFLVKQNWGWDGKLYNQRTGKFQLAPQGQYYVKVSGKIDYANARKQEFVMPVKIDNTAPTIKPALTKLEGNKYNVKFNAKDNMKVCYKMAIVNGDYSKPLAVTDEYDDLNIILPSGYNLITVVAVDFAGNFSQKVDYYINNTFIEIEPQLEKPYVFLKENKLELNYIVNNLFTGLAKLNITLDNKVSEDLPLQGIYKAEGLSEGEHTIKFEMIGNDGKIIATRMHRLCVDTKSPKITLLEPKLLDPQKEVIKLTNGEEEYYFKFKVEDENLLGVSVDGHIVEPKNGIYTTKVFLFPNTTPIDEKSIIAVDEAGNVSKVDVKFDLRSDKPIIKITSPIENSNVQSRNITVMGKVLNIPDGIDKVMVNGIEARGRIAWDDSFEFRAPITFDGYGKRKIQVAAIDSNGASSQRDINVNISPITVENKFTINSPVMKLDYKIAEDCTELDHVEVAVNAEDKINNGKNQSINLKNLSYGFNVVKLNAYKLDGSIISTSTIEINVDNQIPTILRLLDGDKKEIKSGTVTTHEKFKLTGMLSEAVNSVKVNGIKQKVEYAGLLEKDKVYYFDSTEFELQEGVNLLRIEIEDKIGNVNSSILKVIKDTKAPELEILNPQSDQLNYDKDKYNLVIKVKDGLGYKLSVNGDQILEIMSEDYTGEDTLREVEYPIEIKDGENIVTVEAVDMLGQTTSKVLKFYKNINNPMIIVHTKDVLGKKVTISGKAYQLTKLVNKEDNKEIKINKEDSSFTYEKEFDNCGNNKKITLVGYDSVGKECVIEPITVDIEETNEPVISVISPKDNQVIIGKCVKVQGKVEDESDVNITINGKETSVNDKGEFTCNIDFESFGKQVIKIQAVDAFENRSQKLINIVNKMPSIPSNPSTPSTPSVESITLVVDKNEIYSNETAKITVIAKYSDGKTIDVTQEAILKCHNGIIEKGIFKPSDNYKGKATIRAEFGGKIEESAINVKQLIGEKRLAGLNRIQTSKVIAEEFCNGKVDKVVITNGFNFADALSGSTLSKKLNAPILLVGSNSQESKPTLEYIKEHLVKDGTVYVLGGKGAVNEEIVNSIKNLGYNDVQRLSGKNRYETCKAINEALKVEKGTPVVIASGEEFADALSISSVAAAKGYPILLTSGRELVSETKEALKDVNPSKIYIIGGVGAISDKVKNEIKDTVGISEENIVRIAGKDRYKTSLEVAKYFKLYSDKVCFAYGEDFPDALAGSCLASKLNAHIILINNLNIKLQKEYINNTKYIYKYFFGGNRAITEETISKLR